MNQNQTQANQHFERWSETYERSLMQWLLFDRVHKTVLEAIPADVRPEAVLDVGCGTGRLLRKVKARWPQAHLLGVDLAEGMIAQARARLPEGEFRVGPAEALPLADASVDLVLSTMTFHHWQDQPQGVREVARVLRPGGRFYLVDTPKLEGWLGRVYHHGQMASPEQVRAMFTQAGLQIANQRRVLGGKFCLTVGEKIQAIRNGL